jgi:hypothetical protein
MTEWLLGGAMGAVLGALGMGVLLWRESRKRADAEAELERTGTHLRLFRKLVKVLRARMAQRETRVRELEARLAKLDPGQLLDDVFGPDRVPEGDPSPGADE